DHEIHFDRGPALRERDRARIHYVFFGNVLVYYVTHPLGSGFGGDRETGFAHSGNLASQGLGNSRGSKGRDREADFSLFQLVTKLFYQRLKAGIVRGRQGSQAGLVVAALLYSIQDGIDDLLWVSLADRPVDRSSLAESAPINTSSGNLN